MVRYGILHDRASKKRKIKEHSFVFNFQVKYRKNVELTIFLMETSVKVHKY